MRGREKKMTLAEIYKHIEDTYAYYRTAPAAWKVLTVVVFIIDVM